MNELLLTTAAALGFLAFFEPCTIATHTLFAARAHQSAPKPRASALAQLMLARTGLLTLIFGTAATIGLTALPPPVAMVMLSVMGLVYVVTRMIYLPVPHLEFFRLIPRHVELPHGLKLGLTLPACTLPLVLIVGILSALSQQPAVAVLAGFVFAAMFTMPTLWGSALGLSSDTLAFLGKAASLSPYVTTGLLWAAALLLWLQGI